MRVAPYSFLLFVANWALAQNPADDPAGWTKAKWGMTREQIKQEFPQSTDVMDLGTPHLGLPSYVIQGRKFLVLFGFGKDNTVSLVHLIYQKVLVSAGGKEIPLVPCKRCEAAAALSNATSKSDRKKASDAAAIAPIIEAEVNGMVVADEKDYLLSSLTDKYGTPTTHSSSDDHDRDEFLWLFPTTEISLVWYHSQFKKDSAINLFYGQRKKSSDL